MNTFRLEVAFAGRNPADTVVVFTLPVAAPFWNFPAVGASVMLQLDLPRQFTLVVPEAWMILVNRPVVTWVWRMATVRPMAAGAEQATVPVNVTTPVFGLTAAFGPIVSARVP